MKSKTIAVVVLAVVIVAGTAYSYTHKNVGMPEGRYGAPEGQQAAEGKLKVSNFSGKLESVNTGCFADGECYVVVGGKHITTTMGWSQATVGSIVGVESFGDLEKHLGENVEVYAKDNGDGTYTLYGSEGFYVKLVQ